MTTCGITVIFTGDDQVKIEPSHVQVSQVIKC